MNTEIKKYIDIFSIQEEKEPADLKGKFLLINSISWLLVFLIDTFIVDPQTNLKSYSYFFTALYAWFAGFAISCGFKAVFSRIKLHTGNTIYPILFIFFVSGVGAFVWEFFYFTGELIQQNKIEYFFKDFFAGGYLRRVARLFPILTTWSFLYFGVKFLYEMMFQKMKAEEAERQTQFARFQMLRYQLNPHFLFNSLNSIRALIKEDPKSAEKMITQLSNFFRYSLTKTNTSFVPFEEELATVKNYLDIEAKRFEKKLEVIYDIGAGTEKIPVLNFLLHPIIENAIKYGMQTSSLPLKLIIKSERLNDNLKISISNSGKWVDQKNDNDNGTGVGLNNINSRLNNSYPGKHQFLINKSDNYVEIIIIIPAE